jgi:hypothetical protein
MAGANIQRFLLIRKIKTGVRQMVDIRQLVLPFVTVCYTGWSELAVQERLAS